MARFRSFLTDRLFSWTGAALLLFFLVVLVTFRDVLRAGPASFAMVSAEEKWLGVARRDVIFEAWLVARNAHTLARSPHRVFDTEHCAPGEKTMTLGVAMITMGLLAVPVALLTPNPAITYNVATGLLLLIAAMAMYLLVKEWTGIPAAGVVAGLLYAFNPARIGAGINHPSEWDSAWLVLGLYFARRLFAGGRWGDALGLALACSLQIGASFYPLLAAVFFSPAFALWLVVHYHLRHVRLSQIAFIVGVIFVAASLMFGPYLDARASTEALRRTASEFYFAAWSDLLPGGGLFPGWAVLCLAGIGLAVPRKTAAPGITGDPRWVLLGGAVLVMVIAAGPFNNQIPRLIWEDPPVVIPNFYLFLSSFLPGLDSIRIVERFTVAVQVALSILAGMGTAAIIGVAKPREQIVGAVLIALAAFSLLPEPYPREVTEVRADPETLDFFRSLEKLGNEGPVLELPLTIGLARLEASQLILASAYHHRRTSSCFGSYVPPGLADLSKLAAELPEAAAVRDIGRLGFTTLIIRLNSATPAGRRRVHQFEQDVSRHAQGTLRFLLATRSMAAYELRP